MKDLISNTLFDAIQKDDFLIKKSDINISIPKNKNHGDFSTNICFILSKNNEFPPLKIAEKLKTTLLKNDIFEEINIASPGFINFKIKAKYLNNKLLDIITKDNNFGKNKSGKNKKVLFEFVSANPTGPLTVGHGRGAILGDTLSNIFEWNGYHVNREYYYNNAGRQMRVLGMSLQSRCMEKLNIDSKFPEDGYKGEYINNIADELISKFDKKILKNETVEFYKNYAEESIFKNINNTLEKIGIKFDSFFNENTLYETKKIYEIIDRLKEKNLIYKKDDAIWFKGKQVGRESDRVLIKSTGEPTYRLPDMAYHVNKLERNFDLCIDIFGADHMDAYPDVLEVVKQLGYNEKKIKVIIHQFISIIENNEVVKMSTRKANFITLDQLAKDVGSDVLRYFFIMRGINTHLNFDLELAKEKSDKNPVFYIQYAHARIIRIQESANYIKKNLNNINLELLNSDLEIKIIAKLLEFEELISKLTNLLEPQILSTYLYDVSSMFHKYYAQSKIIQQNKKLSEARLVLIDAIRIVINNGLTILGLSSPNKM